MTRRLDAAEAVANAVVGLCLSWAVVQSLWPLMGWQVSPAQGLGVSLLFFALSTARSFALRRLFRRLA